MTFIVPGDSGALVFDGSRSVLGMAIASIASTGTTYLIPWEQIAADIEAKWKSPVSVFRGRAKEFSEKRNQPFPAPGQKAGELGGREGPKPARSRRLKSRTDSRSLVNHTANLRTYLHTHDSEDSSSEGDEDQIFENSGRDDLSSSTSYGTYSSSSYEGTSIFLSKESRHHGKIEKGDKKTKRIEESEDSRDILHIERRRNPGSRSTGDDVTVDHIAGWFPKVSRERRREGSMKIHEGLPLPPRYEAWYKDPTVAHSASSFHSRHHFSSSVAGQAGEDRSNPRGLLPGRDRTQSTKPLPNRDI